MADENAPNKLSLAQQFQAITERILSAVSFLTAGQNGERVNSDVSNNPLTKSSDDSSSEDNPLDIDPSKLSIDGKDQFKVDLTKSIAQAETQNNKGLTYGYNSRKLDCLLADVKKIMTSPGKDKLETENKPKNRPE